MIIAEHEIDLGQSVVRARRSTAGKASIVLLLGGDYLYYHNKWLNGDRAELIRRWDSTRGRSLWHSFSTLGVTLLYERAASRDGGAAHAPGSLAEDVAELEQVRRAACGDQVLLVGLTYGGVLALTYAARYPTHVRGLVLIDTLGVEPTAWLDELQVDAGYEMPGYLSIVDAWRQREQPQPPLDEVWDATWDFAHLPLEYHNARAPRRIQLLLDFVLPHGKGPDSSLFRELIDYQRHYWSGALTKTAQAVAGQEIPTFVVQSSTDALPLSPPAVWTRHLPHARVLTPDPSKCTFPNEAEFIYPGGTEWQNVETTLARIVPQLV
jgi:pimeloyl-ACP methyl ester carboxylesterase